MLFASIVLPIADGVVSVALTGLESLKSSWSIKIAECNNTIQSLGNEEAPTPTTRICGFDIPIEEDEDYDDN